MISAVTRAMQVPIVAGLGSLAEEGFHAAHLRLDAAAGVVSCPVFPEGP